MINKNSHLEILSSCSVCKNKLSRQDLTLILGQNARTVFHASCPKCQTSILVLFSAGQGGILGVGMITDLNKEEAKEKLKPEKITADEMVEIYELVKKLN